MYRVRICLALALCSLISNCGNDGSGSSSGLKSPIIKSGSSPKGTDKDAESTVNYLLSTYLKTPDDSDDSKIDPTDDVNFGISVDMYGDVAVVSQSTSTFYDVGEIYPSGHGQEAVLVFRKNSQGTWRFEQKLEPTDQDTDCPPSSSSSYHCMAFGASVATNGEIIAVGAPMKLDGSDDPVGGIYIYRYTSGTWALEDSFQLGTPVLYDYLGWAVDVSGDGTRVVAGAPGRNTNEGAVVVYKYTSGNWSEESELSEGSGNQYTGRSVAVNSDGTVVVGGSPFEDISRGSAYVWSYSSSWSFDQKLEASTETSGSEFGNSLAISDDFLVVGGYQQGVSSQGQVYIFEYEGGAWTESEIITSANAEALDQFGFDVAISHNTLVVSANFEDGGALSQLLAGTSQSTENQDNQANSGAAYVFTFTDGAWEETGYLKAPNAEVEDFFGAAVGISNGEIIVGAPREDGGNGDASNLSDNAVENSGAAYIFKLAPQ